MNGRESLVALGLGACPCGLEDADRYPNATHRTSVPTSKNCPIHYCSGASDCTATQHIHGCFADRGKCARPLEHAAGRPVYDKTTGDYLGQA